MKNFYWCGWTVKDDLDQDNFLESWPKEMVGWWTGSGEGYTTWCGIVRAETLEAAREIYMKNYVGQEEWIGDRWEPHLSDTTPSDRFPGKADFVKKILAAEKETEKYRKT